jgi:hypothetical protein
VGLVSDGVEGLLSDAAGEEEEDSADGLDAESVFDSSLFGAVEPLFA